MPHIPTSTSSWHGDLDGTVRPLVTDRFDGPGSAAPDQALTALTDDGWAARVVSTERFPRLRGDSAGGQLRIVWLDDAILLTMRGRSRCPSMPPPPAACSPGG